MKYKRLIVIAVIAVMAVLAVKGFAIFRKSDFIDNVIFLDDSADIPDDRRLILVNSENAVPKGYEPELVQLSNGVCVDSIIYPDLQKMFDDAREQGVYPVVGEGYRTNQQQKDMMNQKIDSFIDEGYSKREAKKLAENRVAVPGKSEHELGLAVDINADYDFCSDDEVYSWLAENAYKYGFILRYPYGREDITGIDYEPWHYRYVGAETAEQIYLQQITLEEFLGAVK